MRLLSLNLLITSRGYIAFSIIVLGVWFTYVSSSEGMYTDIYLQYMFSPWVHVVPLFELRVGSS